MSLPAAALSVVLADITTLDVDVIVNAANSSLLGGGGVDGAIHRAAGPELLHRCRLLGGCRTGEAKLTPGFGLTARWIVHTVGPVWQGGHMGEPDLLASCYRSALELAHSVGAQSIGFPAISTGVYGYPQAEAAEIAVATVRQSGRVPAVVFVCFDAPTRRIYDDLLEDHTQPPAEGITSE